MFVGQTIYATEPETASLVFSGTLSSFNNLNINATKSGIKKT